MPTPTRQFRAADDVWFPALEKAEAAGESVADVLRDALERYNAGIGAEQQPDDTVHLVRWRNKPSGPRSKVAPWSYSTPLPETEARSMLKTMRRNMKTADIELIRRSDYVVS